MLIYSVHLFQKKCDQENEKPKGIFNYYFSRVQSSKTAGKTEEIMTTDWNG